MIQDKDAIRKLRAALAQKGYEERSNYAGAWLANKVARRTIPAIGKNRVNAFDMQDRKRQRPMLGSMYFFVYDAKHKDTLPFFDRFPLVFPIERYGDGFLGLNFHYLTPPWRAILLHRLESYASDKSLSPHARIRMTYSTLKGMTKMNFADTTIKRYLFRHVRSKYIYIEPEEWNTAIFLPAENWYHRRDAMGRFTGKG